MAEGCGKDPLKVADRLRLLCSRREYCRSDIMKKALDALDGDVSEAGRIVDLLAEEKYVDDYRYASAYARDKASISGWGSLKIRHMLSAKGIKREVIDEALENIDEDKASARLDRLIESKARSLKDDPQARLKLMRYALGRGYGYEEVKVVIDRCMKNKDKQIL